MSHAPQKGAMAGPPHTPATRLPLSELIANTVDTMAQEIGQETSPEERVLWKHCRSPDSSGLTTSSTPLIPSMGRGKKRARSSSPLASPSSKPKDPLDLHSLHKPLNPSMADPADELWNRYAVNSKMKPAAGALAESAIAHLMHSSSPRSNLKTPPAAAGLRRSTSCGTEWPASNAKRRKLSASHIKLEADVMSAPLQPMLSQGPARSKLSRVSLLVDRIQQSLTHPPKQADVNVQAPAQARPRSCPSPDSTASQPQHSSFSDSALSSSALQQALATLDASSEFGDLDDDGLDLALCDMADAAAGPTNTAPTDTVQPRPAPTKHATSDPTEPHSAIADASAVKPDMASAAHQPVDDFAEDDDEDDMDAAELETVLAQFDNRTPQDRATADHDAAGKEVQPARGAGTLQERTDCGGSSDDEFGDVADLDFDLAAADLPPQHQLPTPSSRYLIKSVAEQLYYTSKSQTRPEKVLLVEEEKTKVAKTIILRQSWFDTPCTVGAFVHLIGDFALDGRCVVDDARHMLILHPDHLISSTVVADSFGCTRRAVLQDRVKATNEANPPQVYGHILHEIFQEAMRTNRWDDDSLAALVEEVVMRHLESVYEVKLEVSEAIDHLNGKVAQLQAWAKVFVSAKPKAGALINDRNGRQARMSVNKLLDVEEHVWSPMYGLKGNIDATVQITMDDDQGRKTLTVPFEVKTGRNTANAAHRAQTALYTLLLSDRYDIEVVYGILYYMETSDVTRIPAIRHELRHMVMQRNELACYVRDRLELPPMLKSPHLCGRCYAKVPCFIYHKLIDGGTSETSGVKEKFNEVVQHLKPEHQTFFQHWDHLLTKEETDMQKFRRELWTMLSTEREQLGRCFANVTIESGATHEAENAPKINRFRYTLVKQAPGPNFSFVDSQIAVGEPIVISDEKGHFALANGYVTQIRKHKITVAVDRRLHNARTRHPGFDAEKNQTFAGIMEVLEEGESPMVTPAQPEPVLYRLDKDEFNNGMATVRNNLIQVMTNGPFGSREIRSLVVEGRRPYFKPVSTAYTLPDGSKQASPNEDQKRAIEKVMSARDYALVLGMPGTGKTTTIAHIIRALVSQGKSVLLTSYTHNAVDNILLKIRDDNIRILRLGAIAKIHPEVQEFAELAGVPKKTIEELQATYHGPQIVATTCLGVNHAIFNERVFDYCIVDEASQITLPVCLGPIRMAKTFVLVGDHNQLPPLVQNAGAREGGLDISLFKLLSDKHPESVVNLEHQYRMCEEIMTLSNTLIYDGLLKCGNEAVARRSLTIPHMDGLNTQHRPSLSASSLQDQGLCPGAKLGTCWLRDVLDPTVKACFIDTDALLPRSREDAKGSRIVNAAEAALCTQLVSALLSSGVTDGDIGVISVYRSQLALLKHHLRHRVAVEMHTADRFQGRDKEVVILSLVRNNEAHNVGDLLRDWRRINVAFTRARTKLLILGSRSTLAGGNDLLKRFVDLMDSRRWIYHLPPNAESMHACDDSATQSGCASLEVRSVNEREGEENIPPADSGVEKEKHEQHDQTRASSRRAHWDWRPDLS
ncbi:MAG: Tripartite DNA replication factor [Thelocarpon superellum]|nr:MAG: Tripartite DNA replication factor [Thelocarpon superellum]